VDESQVEAHFGLLGDCANHFRRTRWYSKVTWLVWNFISVHLEIVLVSVQDRCLLCTKSTIGSDVFDAPEGTPW
jgi:hypothetical protein